MHGLLLALAAYILWGCFPLFFNLLAHVPAMEVLASRVLWSFIATFALILLVGRTAPVLQILKNRKSLAWLSLSALMISANWLLFIWAVSQRHVLESSLGYFITPLVSLLLGRLVLKEHMHPLQALAGVIAALGVAFELFALGSLPWVSLLLALTFGLYGLIRKQQPVDGLNGLAIETLLVLPLALLWFGWQLASGTPLHFGHDWYTSLLLMASGVVTAVPLVMFAAAAHRLDLSVIGFIMYINPTLQFVMAVFVLDEPYTPQRLITFLIIWIAMGFFVTGLWRASARNRVA